MSTARIDLGLGSEERVTVQETLKALDRFLKIRGIEPISDAVAKKQVVVIVEDGRANPHTCTRPEEQLYSPEMTIILSTPLAGG